MAPPSTSAGPAGPRPSRLTHPTARARSWSSLDRVRRGRIACLREESASRQRRVTASRVDHTTGGQRASPRASRACAECWADRCILLGQRQRQPGRGARAARLCTSSRASSQLRSCDVCPLSFSICRSHQRWARSARRTAALATCVPSQNPGATARAKRPPPAADVDAARAAYALRRAIAPMR